MLQTIILIVLGILITSLLIVKANYYDKKKELLLNHAINGDISISNLQSDNNPRTYCITYTDHGNSIKTQVISATNKTEASYLFSYNNGYSHFKIKSIQKI